MAAGREYRVAGKTTWDFDRAAGRAVALSVARHESVCIETIVNDRVVERIDVQAALSIDTTDQQEGTPC
jgi:hypothetical protein